MPFQHGLQASRFELKFIIEESRAAAIRHFLAGHLEPDEHSRGSPDRSYPVHSLYLDSKDLILFQQTAGGLKNRFKLRVRFYDGNPESPAFVEIKRRITGVICKERATVHRRGVECLLDGGWADGCYLKPGDVKSEKSLQNFRSLYETIDGGPRIYVSYRREAYVSPESDHIRVTFDRALAGSAFDRSACLIPPKGGIPPNVGGVILELKFTDRFPAWMQEMVEAFDLHARSVPKYNMCIEAMGLEPRQSDQRPLAEVYGLRGAG